MESVAFRWYFLAPDLRGFRHNEACPIGSMRGVSDGAGDLAAFAAALHVESSLLWQDGEGWRRDARRHDAPGAGCLTRRGRRLAMADAVGSGVVMNHGVYHGPPFWMALAHDVLFVGGLLSTPVGPGFSHVLSVPSRTGPGQAPGCDGIANAVMRRG